MVEVTIEYEGQFHCRATHTPSGAELPTDAPKDNMGKGQAFSPTDLVATALGSCILTTMAIVAQRHGIELKGASATVIKEMVSQPSRRIGKLATTVRIPISLSPEDRQRLENAGHTCPVHKSLHPDVQAPITFHWNP